ncbi:MAG TPA: GNAT family N-acetyltransferase [Mycobacteriales bacterium]|jgi:ribosomal protein S18 acetylase RimI-like enzyme|nr:GNAT family N-acetyltransferase [Mycobacteriales bacterium]
MQTSLSPGFVTRRPTEDDAEEIHGLVAACDVAAIGAVDTTVEDLADELVEPDFDLERDGWLVYAGDRLVGWAWACRKGESDNVDIDVYVHPDHPDAAAWMWDAVERRAAEIAHELGHQQAVVDVGIHAQDAAKRAAADERGYAVATVFYRMRIDHEGRVEDPELPPGVTLETADDDDTVRRAAHGVEQGSFAEHFGFVPKSYDSWLADKESQSAFDWSQLRLARVDGEPAAMLAGNNQFVPDDNCGYVPTLATLPGYRGRGLGALLLRDAFARDARAGRVGTYLHVDANNTTPALGLYESVGMRKVMAIEVWRRTVSA